MTLLGIVQLCSPVKTVAHIVVSVLQLEALQTWMVKLDKANEATSGMAKT